MIFGQKLFKGKGDMICVNVQNALIALSYIYLNIYPCVYTSVYVSGAARCICVCEKSIFHFDCFQLNNVV